MPNDSIMTIRDLTTLLHAVEKEAGNYDIYLSSDDEGNEFSPMNRNAELSVALDVKGRRLIFFPDQFNFLGQKLLKKSTGE